VGYSGAGSKKPPDMTSLSVCIITYNEEKNLPRLLRSIEGIADEIVIMDSGSKDRTVQLGRAAGARTFQWPFRDFGDQKNFAAAQAQNDWVLSLDADEELSEELKESLRTWKTQTPNHDVYEMARRTWYLGAWIRHSRWYPDRQRKLYRRDKAKFSNGTHATVQFAGTVGRVRGDLLHYTVGDLAEHEAKAEKYSTSLAQEMFAAGRRKWRSAMWVAAPWSWIHHYLIGAGFLDGYRGRLIARIAAKTVWLKFEKLGRLVEEERPEKELKGYSG
jgi:glycosyltransferase involved in cell wall biosynthesis